MMTFFCIKRLIFGLSTAFLTDYVVPHMYVYIFIPLFFLSFNIVHRPMTSRILNFKENMNEFLVLICAYFIPLFTQWICDPMLRYQIGWIYIYAIMTVVFINLLLIFYHMFIGIRKAYRKRIWLKKWDAYFETVQIAKN